MLLHQCTRNTLRAVARVALLPRVAIPAACALSTAANAPHFKVLAKPHPLTPPAAHLCPDPALGETAYKAVWSAEEVDKVEETHMKPSQLADRVALAGIRCVRAAFDVCSGYAFGPITEHKLLRRIIFLETVAGIPGMVAGSLRHLDSLRKMRRDQGWIHTLLEEAENERMHLMCFTELKNPGKLFQLAAMAAQGVFWNVYFVAYLLSPSLCHRFVGYLEEEAVRTYTKAIEAYDAGQLGSWQSMAAPTLAKQYWYLADDATMRDVLLAVRADESNHRDVNHTLAGTHARAASPFKDQINNQFQIPVSKSQS